jgi:amidase
VAFCGIVGFRPSPGVVPSPERAIGLSPFPVTGPMGRSVADAHLLLRAQVGVDARDPYSSDNVMRIPEYLADIDLGTVRVAISTDLGCCPVDEGIARTFQSRVKTFTNVFNEAQYIDPDLDGVHEVFEAYRGIYFVGAHGERLAKYRDLLDTNVIDNTERGLKITAAEMAQAGIVQSKLYKQFLAFFQEVDILICPAAAVSPFPHTQLFVDEINGEKMPTYMRWLALSYALTTVLPVSCVIPCGLDEQGMPFGIQIVGPNGSDGLVLEVAHALEQILADNPLTCRPIPDLAKLGA